MENVSQNKRSYFRIYFDTPLCSSMTIALIENEPINIGKSNVCIKDISAGGLRFVSSFEMPVSKDIILDFKTVIFSQEVLFSGFIVRRNLLQEGIWEYGVQFIPDKEKRSKYLEILNKLALKLRKKYSVDDCSFCEVDNTIDCLNSSK